MPYYEDMLKKAYLEITNICNLSCAFCPGTRREKRMLTREEFTILATKLRPHVAYLYFHLMGEPLLHPLLGEFLEIAGKLGFKVMITTNGTLLEKGRPCAKARPCSRRTSRCSPSRQMRAGS